MKSKHIATYGKKAVNCSFGSSHHNVTVSHKSTIAALLAQGQLLYK